MLSQNEKLYAKICAERTTRSSNFSTEEVKILLQLLDDRKEIIESKKTDRTTLEEKTKAWLEIEEEFNAAFEDYRSFKVLKTKYENLKKDLKRKLPEKISNTNLIKRMQENINSLEDSQFSDYKHKANLGYEDEKPHRPLNEDELNAAAEQYAFETLLFGDQQTSTSKIHTNSSKHNERQIQKESDKRRPSADIWEQVAHTKLKKLDLEMNIMEEEWKLRKMKMELEIENIKIENKFKEEKNKLELELIRNKCQDKNCS